MNLFVFESISGATNCYGILARGLEEAARIMDIEKEAGEECWLSRIDEQYEEYHKIELEKLHIPYTGPYRIKYKLIGEFHLCPDCHNPLDLESGIAFMVEE